MKNQLLVVVTGILGAMLLAAADRPNEPPYFAIRNARLVTVSGPVIENGVIIVAKGLIAAVGTDVAIPPEAWVIEGRGLTVYPGLIDALTTLGLQDPASAGQGFGGGAELGPPRQPQPATPQQQQRQQTPQEIARGPEDRPSTTTWERAADRLVTSDRRLENWRKAGFTAAVTAPDRGIFSGQAALINLAGERPNEMVVKAAVGMRINLSSGGGFGSFPGALMGVLAYVQQVFLDTEHYGKAVALYEAQPAGQQRPAYDRALEPLRETITARRPVLIPASSAKDIRRLVEMSQQWGVQPLLYGAQQAYEATDALAPKKVPVLVSLKWPEKPRDADPELDESLRTLRLRDRAHSSPAALHKAGVPFAFYSDGMANPRDMLKNAKKAIDAGLPADRALRALTLSAAEIYGASDCLGSLQAGKIANLTVTDGDLFEEKTKIRMVFVDGRKFEIRDPGRPTATPTVRLTGKWTITANSPQGSQESTADLTMAEDGGLTGSISGSMGSASITSGWVSENKFSFTMIRSTGSRAMETTYTGTVEGDRMTGSVRLGTFSIEFSGTRSGGA